MVKKQIAFILLSILFLTIFTLSAFTKDLVIDEAGILNADTMTRLNAYLDKVSAKSKSETVILIVNDTKGKTPEAYADDYFDYNGFGFGDEREGSLLLFVTGDGTEGKRHVHISTSGKNTIGTLTDSRIEDLLDAVIDGGLRNGNYEAGFNAYIKRLARFFYNSLSGIEILASLGAALLIFIFKFFGTQKKYKAKKAHVIFNMEKNSVAAFTPIQDVFLSSNTVSRVIQASKESSNTSQSSTHTSSSGRTHGGGGRSF